MENQKFTFNCPHCGQHLEAETDWVGLECSSICWGKIFFPQPCINSNSNNTFLGKIISGRMVGIVALASVVAIAIPVASAYSYAPIGNTDYYSVWTSGPVAWSNNQQNTEKKDSSRVIETEPPTQPEASQQSGKMPKLYRFDYRGRTYTAMEIIGTGYYCILSAKENSTPFYWSEWKLEQIFQDDPRYCAKRPIFQESGWHFQKAPDRFEYRGRTHNMVAIPETDYYSVWVNGGTPSSWSKERLDMAKRDYSYRAIESEQSPLPKTEHQTETVTEWWFSYNGKIYNAEQRHRQRDDSVYYCVSPGFRDWSEERMAQVRQDPSYKVIPPETAQLTKQFPKRFSFGEETFTAHEIPDSCYVCVCPDEGSPFVWTTMQMTKTENDPSYGAMLPVQPETAQQPAKSPERFKYDGNTYNAYEVPGTDYYCVWTEDDKPMVWPKSKMAQTKRDSSYSAGEIRKEMVKR